jgi:hypothetical protein
MLKNIITLIALTIIVIGVYDFIVSYRKSTNSGWQRVWDAGKGSATIVWQQLGLMVAGLLAASSSVTDWVCSLINDPSAAESVKSIIGAYVTPTTAGAAMAVFTLVTVWARLRTLKPSV